MLSTCIGYFSIFAVIFRSFGATSGCCDYAQHDGVAATASLQGGGCDFVSKRRLNHTEDKAALRVIDLREGVAAAAGFGAAEAGDRGQRRRLVEEIVDPEAKVELVGERVVQRKIEETRGLEFGDNRAGPGAELIDAAHQAPGEGRAQLVVRQPLKRQAMPIFGPGRAAGAAVETRAVERFRAGQRFFLELVQPCRDVAQVERAPAAELEAVGGVDVEARRRQPARVDVGRPDEPLALDQPQRPGLVAIDQTAEERIVIIDAVVQGEFWRHGVDEVLHVDREIVQSQREAGERLGRQHDPGRPGRGNLGIETGVAAGHGVEFAGGAVENLPVKVCRHAAARALLAACRGFGRRRGGIEVAGTGIAQTVDPGGQNDDAVSLRAEQLNRIRRPRGALNLRAQAGAAVDRPGQAGGPGVLGAAGIVVVGKPIRRVQQQFLGQRPPFDQRQLQLGEQFVDRHLPGDRFAYQHAAARRRRQRQRIAAKLEAADELEAGIRQRTANPALGEIAAQAAAEDQLFGKPGAQIRLGDELGRLGGDLAGLKDVPRHAVGLEAE